jgi:hypothetical protein
MALNPLRPLALAVLHHGASVDAQWESVCVNLGKHAWVYRLDFIAKAPGRPDICVPYMNAPPGLRHLPGLLEIAQPVARGLSDPLVAIAVLEGHYP